MNENNLLGYLTDLIAEQLARPPVSTKPGLRPAARGREFRSTRGGDSRTPHFPGLPVSGQPTVPDKPAISQQANRIANELLQQAITFGLPFNAAQSSKRPLTGGNTAELVAQISLNMPFVFKFDQESAKLVDEAKTMRAIKNDVRLPSTFRDAWATIYAIYEQGPPYAYLMEYFPPADGWLSLEDRLYQHGEDKPANVEATRMVGSVLDVLFQGYSHSVNKRSRPNLREDYCSRIAQRLAEAEQYETSKLSSRHFTSRPLIINGVAVKPWREYAALLERHADFIDRITPPFSTVAHGDPNPGNLMLKIDVSSITVKLIDPKDWTTGDYLFDVSKLTHFLLATGPAEYAPGAALPSVTVAEQDAALALNYVLPTPAWTAMAVEDCLARVRTFAKTNGDEMWQARYELGMAANLLGLPIGRLKKNRLDPALIFMAEGLLWLDKFCARLAPDFRDSATVLYAPPDTIEPPSLQTIRAWVQQRIPDATPATDRRGFQQLQWAAPARVGAQKPWELSFEHEARLCCADERQAQQVRQLVDALDLHEKSGQSFLPGDLYKGMAVKRYQRMPGAQSVDRYYDIRANGAGMISMIARQITLRERIAASSFMTWQGEGELRAWNLELPFVALGSGGLTARLELNWIDSWENTFADCLSGKDEAARNRNPLALAADLLGIEIAALEPVIQHTTFREKFGILNALDDEVFVINIDHVVAQDLRSGRIGSYVDIDIASVAVIDEDELKRLSDLVAAIAEHYRLVPNPRTKAQRDASVIGMVDISNR